MKWGLMQKTNPPVCLSSLVAVLSERSSSKKAIKATMRLELTTTLSSTGWATSNAKGTGVIRRLLSLETATGHHEKTVIFGDSYRVS